MGFKIILCIASGRQFLTAFLVPLLTFGCLVSVAPVQAFHFPWDQGHDTTEPNPPEEPGPCEGAGCENDPCNAGSTGSPVYLATGHLVWSETDIVLKGRPVLLVNRTFNSHDPRVGLFGAGWSMSCDQGLLFTVRYEVVGGPAIQEFVRRLPNGKRYIYSEQVDGSYSAPGIFDLVTRLADNTARLQHRDGSFKIYNENGTLASESDKNGNAVNFSYDTQGRLTQKADTNGRSLTYEFNTNGLVNVIRDHTGREWLYGYDIDANLISVTDPLGGARQYSYTQYQPPGDGQTYSHLTQVADETGVVETEVTYNGNRVASYRELENTFTYQYDIANRRATKTDSQGSQWVFTYNLTGQYTQIVAPLNRTSVYDRDSDSLLTRFVDPSGTEYTYAYDQFSNLLTGTDIRGTSTVSYDQEKPWPLTITSRSGRVSTMTYDGNGNPLTIVDPDGQTTSLTWSPQGDLQQSTSALGNQTALTYNSQGLALTSVDALGRATQYQYDALNNLTQMINPAGEITQYQYDVLNRVIASTDGEGDTTSFSYDAANRVTQVTAANTQTVLYAYDSFGRLSQRTFYDGTIANYQFRSDNLLTQFTRPDNVVVTNFYDAAKRLTQRNIGSEDTYNYSYNLRDEVISVNNATGTVTLAYDTFGRLTSETVNGEVVTYQYNTENEITQMASLGISQDQQYDVRGLLQQIDVNGSSYQYSYDALTRLTAIDRSAAADSTLQYDAANQLLQINHGIGLRGHQYQYDQAGRVSQWQGVAGETRNYAYDLSSRLVDVQSPASPEAFTYDALGNRQNDNAQFDAANRITDNDGFTYSYDVMGNRTQKINKVSGEVERYSYNSLDQLVGYQTFANSDPNAVALVDYTYAFGPFGRRWLKQNNITSVANNFYWSGSNMVGETDGSTTRRYVLAGITPIAFIEAGEIYHYTKDHLGTAHEVIDDNSNLVWQGDYSSFGEVVETVSIVENNLRFAGQYHDRESGLYYNYFRDYDPSLGRYVESDPIGLMGGINTYG